MIRTANQAAESKDPVLDYATTGLDRNSHCAFLQFVVANKKGHHEIGDLVDVMEHHRPKPLRSTLCPSVSPVVKSSPVQQKRQPLDG
jgi:hypothetical protein